MSWTPSQVQALASGFGLRGTVKYSNPPTNDMELTLAHGQHEWNNEDIAYLEAMIGCKPLDFSFHHFNEQSTLTIAFRWR